MANAFVQPDVNLNAFSPSAQTSQMLAGKTGTPFDALNSLLAGQYRLQQEQAVADQNAAAKAAAAAKATTQQEFDNKIKTDTLALAQGKANKPKVTPEQAQAMATLAVSKNPNLAGQEANLISSFQAGNTLGLNVSPTTGRTEQDISFSRGGESVLDKKLIDFEAVDQQTSNLIQSFKNAPADLFTFQGRLGSDVKSLGSKAGLVKLSPEEKKQRVSLVTLRSDAGALLASYIKSISGAAVTEAEAARLKASMPVSGKGLFDFDSELDFKTKMARFEETQVAIKNRLLEMKRLGIGVEEASSQLPLDDFLPKQDEVSLANARAFIAANPDKRELVIQRLQDNNVSIVGL